MSSFPFSPFFPVAEGGFILNSILIPSQNTSVLNDFLIKELHQLNKPDLD